MLAFLVLLVQEANKDPVVRMDPVVKKETKVKQVKTEKMVLTDEMVREARLVPLGYRVNGEFKENPVLRANLVNREFQVNEDLKANKVDRDFKVRLVPMVETEKMAQMENPVKKVTKGTEANKVRKATVEKSVL